MVTGTAIATDMDMDMPMVIHMHTTIINRRPPRATLGKSRKILKQAVEMLPQPEKIPQPEVEAGRDRTPSLVIRLQHDYSWSGKRRSSALVRNRLREIPAVLCRCRRIRQPGPEPPLRSRFLVQSQQLLTMKERRSYKALVPHPAPHLWVRLLKMMPPIIILRLPRHYNPPRGSIPKLVL